TRRQKRLYRHLKSEVNKSQRGVYRAKAGYIRERPLTAPDLSMYTPRNASTKSINFSAQTAYQRIQNKVKLARPGDGVVTDTSDRPLYVEAEPVEKPCGITEDDLQDTQKKFEVLQFDMETIDGRFQIIKEDTMDMYYPGHKDRHQEDRSVLKPRPKSEMLPSHNNHEEITLKERPKSESHLLQLRQAKKVATKSASRPNPSVSSTKMKDGHKTIIIQVLPGMSESCKTDLSAADSCRTVDTGYSSFDERSSTLEESKAEKPHTSYSDRQSLSHSHSATSTRNSSSGTKKDSQLKKVGIEIVPHMDHSKPRPVSVGGIGTISLLENISEARYWEDAYNVDITDEASSDDSDAHTLSSTDSGISRRQGDELQSSLALLKQRLSEEPVQTKVKDKLLKNKSKFKCQDQNTLEKEMRIKRQRRLQQPRARTNQNLVISSESIKSKCESGSRQAISSTVGKEQAINIDHKPLVRQSDGKLARSVSAPMSSTFHHKDKSSEKREKISYTNNAKGKKISKLEAEMTKVLNKNPKVGRLVKRGEGLLSPDLMKKLISTLA
ncbi:uncharacterized protein LOC132546781, partial [Ylistrum balloti]|uniref:uncharacterized protein LOC132546781 n=1 Tax=Ylistrum balloti TaxID=509963 RepID=UPI002905A58C